MIEARRPGRLFGPLVTADGVRFRLWAPGAERVDLMIGEAERPMRRAESGFHEVDLPAPAVGAAYAFRTPAAVVPDPASRAQETDVHGRSLVVDPVIFGRNRRLGRPWHEAVVAEVHVGTATEEGTFAALSREINRFAESGITAIQLMPVAAFPGRFGWGYDGVLPFAPAPAYGGPEDLLDLVAAAHRQGLMIFQDVVYNHFGPDGNYLHAYAEDFFDGERHTPWGAAIDFRREEVRRFFVENALMWVEDYGFDGLRFDAVHAYHPDGLLPFVRELAEEMASLDPRPILIAENELNLADILERDPAGEPMAFTAQWNDDFHNALHVALTGEREGYYAGYANDPVALLVRTLRDGFAWQGEPMPHHEGRRRGQPSGHLPPTAFVNFVQNHDQVGNRPVGDRLTEMLRGEALEVARFLLLMAPQVPMIFMGEDFGAQTRFPFFCDFGGDLAEAVRSGRKREFASFAGFSREIPDPVSEETFRSAKLDWAAGETADGAGASAGFRTLVEARRRHLWPLLASPARGAVAATEATGFAVGWRFDAGRLVLAANLSGEAVTLDLPDGLGSLDDEARIAAIGSVHPSAGRLLVGPWAAAAWVTP